MTTALSSSHVATAAALESADARVSAAYEIADPVTRCIEIAAGFSAEAAAWDLLDPFDGVSIEVGLMFSRARTAALRQALNRARRSATYAEDTR